MNTLSPLWTPTYDISPILDYWYDSTFVRHQAAHDRHANDLRLGELGHDFSNLLRCSSETVRQTCHHTAFRFDPTVFANTNKDQTRKEDPLLSVILDTGASHGLTMSAEDLIELTYGNFGSMSTAASNNQFPIIGSGIVAYDAISENGEIQRWTYPANLCQAAGTRLCSPQVCADYLNLDRRYPSFESNHVFASLQTSSKTDRLTVPIDHETNLPIVKVKHHRPEKHTRKRPSHCRCGSTRWCRCVSAESMSVPSQTISQMLNAHPIPDLMTDENRNLSKAQRQLLLDHQRMGHIGMRHVQRLYSPLGSGAPTTHNENGDSCLLPRFQSSTSCEIPKCEACLLAKARRRPTRATTKVPNKQSRPIPPTTDLKPGDLVSIDHFESSVRGRLLHTRGRELPQHRYCGGSLFYDHASQAIFTYPQVSLASSDTIRSKESFEDLVRQLGHSVRHYHTDNGVFTSDAFRQSLSQDRNQHRPLHTRSGTGAHHQNGNAQRGIQTVTHMARTMMLQCHLRWPEAFCPTLWPMALSYATWIYNHVPSDATTLSPMERFTGSKMNCEYLRRLRVCCPAYVLHARLQDGKKLPKWNSRAKRGQFLGFSPSHSTTIGLIRNLETNNITPQFHVAYDKQFHTVASSWTPPPTDSPLPDLFTCDFYLDGYDETLDGPLPELDSEWSLDDEPSAPASRPPPIRPDVPSIPTMPEGENAPPASPSSPHLPHFPPVSTPARELSQEPGEPPLDVPLAPDFEEPGEPLLEPSVDEPGEPPLNPPADEPGEPLLDQSPVRPRRQRHAPRRLPDPDRHARFQLPPTESQWDNTTRSLNHSPHCLGFHMNQLDWTVPPDPTSDTVAAHFEQVYHRQATSTLGLIDEWDPRFLAAKAFDADAPSVFEVRHMCEEERTKWYIAMDKELNELEAKGTFRLVPRSKAAGKEIVDTMWTLKRKRLPDGTISRYKARLVVRGDQQKATFDKEDTFAPVIDWPAVRLMLILSLQHNLTTVSIDFKNAFVQSSLPEPIFVNLPKGYGGGHTDRILEVTKSLYGDCRAPRLWYDHLKAQLSKLGLKPDGSDPCLFCKENVVLVTYVDDAIICGTDQDAVNEILNGLKKLDMDFDHLGDLPTYLGVQITRHEDGSMELKQPHLTESIIAALGLTDSRAKGTPASRTIGKETDKPPLDEGFNYRSVVGMLLCLGNNTRPDCAFAIHQAARFSNNPRQPHGKALKRIGRYLQGTQDKGLILHPSKDMTLNCYVDADFAGIWGNEDPHDSTSVRSRTGFIITLGDSPVTWSSKLQTEIALSTMEAEYIAASTSMRTLLPLRRQLLKLTQLPDTSIVSIVWEDNQAALNLSTKDPPRMTPRSKHIAIKYHWLREKLSPGKHGIKMRPIATDDQLGDCFTKPLELGPFETARKKILGW